MHEKYKGRGVVFLGFTAREMENCRYFLLRQGITWPNAYGVGELRTAAPVIYVVGADGRVIWSDEHARHRHATESLIETLDGVLEGALAHSAGLGAGR